MVCVKYLSSYEEVENLVKDVQIRRIFNPELMEHFRGQGRPEYKLIPNISRGLNTGKDVRNKERETLSFLQSKMHEKVIKKVLRKDSALNESQNLWNFLIQAQHLGLPTRFLDWSLSWEVALWFAVENPSNDNVDGQFWIFSVPNEIHPTDTRDNFYNKDLLNLDKTYLINAPIYWSEELKEQIGEIRRQRQFGKFSVSSFEKSLIPLENQPEINQYLEKYCIPAKAKKEIRLKLASLGLLKEWLHYREANSEIIEKINKLTENNTKP